MIELNRCTIGDSAKVLCAWAAAGVRAELCVTSPPFDDLRTYGGHTWDFEQTALALRDIMVEGGVVCWNVGDSTVDGSETLTSAEQKIFFRRYCGFRVHDTMIYEKSNFSHPERVRYHQMFEYVFILSKGAPRCFNPIRDKVNASAGDPGSFGKNTVTQRDGSKGERKVSVIAELGMRGNIWRGLTAGQESFGRDVKHPAMMPAWLARDLIVSWSNPGDLVIDPHYGSGTTGEQAQKLGRDWLGIDVNAAYEPLWGEGTRQLGMAV